MILTSNSPLPREAGCPLKDSARLLAGHRMTRAHRHDRLIQLRVRPSLAQHQVHPRGQLPGHGHLGHAAIFAARQATIEALQLRIVTRRRLPRFHQQKAQKRTALFADLAQPLFSAAVFRRWILRSESAQNNCPLAWPIRTVPPDPTSTPWPTPSPAPLPDASSTAPLPAAAVLLPPLAAPVLRVRPGSTACTFSAPRDSAPWPAADSWCASAPAPACADAPATAAHPASPGLAPRSAETDLRSADASDAPRPADPSSACAPPRPAPAPHPQTTARTPTPPAAARTTDSARTPPSPPALLAPPATGKTALPPPGAATAFPPSLPFGCQRSQSAETQDENHSL